MKFISICDPTRYGRPPLDVPTFYQHMARDQRIDFFHLPTGNVFQENGSHTQDLNEVQVVKAQGELPYDVFVDLASTAHHRAAIDSFDVVFCRTLKPFPEHYLERLKAWEDKVRFVNRPSGIQEQIQSDFLQRVASDFTPELLVTRHAEEALAFLEHHGTIVAKRANSCGGKGVFKVWHENGQFHTDNRFVGSQSFDDFDAVMAYLLPETSQTNQPTDDIQFVRYLAGVSHGDKRVVVVDGEIYGAYIRRSKSGHWVHNVSGDGECILAEITAAEQEAIEATVGAYGDRGLHTLGYDFLMDETGTWRISEINAGNIGGFARLELLTQQPVMDRFIDWLVEFAQR